MVKGEKISIEETKLSKREWNELMNSFEFNKIFKIIINANKHPMKVIIIMPYGRSGVDLLQSLFDNHEEISQFPGFFAWSDFLKKS